MAFPHLPSNTKEIGTFGDVAIDQVVIGSCTNGRMEDMQAAAKILKGKKVAPYLQTSLSGSPIRPIKLRLVVAKARSPLAKMPI